jgi:hypothetical protein
MLWRRKTHSAKVGRPRIPREHINFIRRISGDHPDWGEDKIAEELAAKFGIEHSTSTIRCYKIPKLNAPRGDQAWRTFIRNHGTAVWSCDSLRRHTAFFTVAYIFVMMEIGLRRIVHVNVTPNPTLGWVKQQIRLGCSELRSAAARRDLAQLEAELTGLILCGWGFTEHGDPRSAFNCLHRRTRNCLVCLHPPASTRQK